MASIFLKSTTTLFLIFSTLISITIAFIVDSDGDPLRNGGAYYVIPQTTGAAGAGGGGLSLTFKFDTSACPSYITQDPDTTSLGIPVKITSSLLINYIDHGMPLRIEFQDVPQICMESPGWKVVSDETTGRSYVGIGSNELYLDFEIEDERNGMFKLKYIDVGSVRKDIGFFKIDGLLGITSEIPLHVVFKKASSDGVFAKES